MRPVLLVVSGALLIALNLSGASACMDATLASYIGLGAGGCTIGTNTLDAFQIVSGTAGATEISPADVAIHPSGGELDPELTVSVDRAAAANTLVELIFSYQIAGNQFSGSSITVSGSSETGDGAVSYVQNFCAGGVFDSAFNCSGLPGTLIAVDGVQNHDSATINPTNPLVQIDDFVLDGGLAGSAAGGTFTDRFSAVPEPFTFLLTGLGLALGIAIQSSRARSARSQR